MSIHELCPQVNTAGVILIDLHGEVFVNTYQQAHSLLEQEQPHVYLRPGMPFGATWSARAFVDCFHPDGRYSVTAHARETGCPTLCVFGAEECAGPQILPLCGVAMQRLRDAAYDHVTVEVIDGANHSYEGRDIELFEVIRHWLMAV